MRLPPIPKEFSEALAQRPIARQVWEKLPPSHKREYLEHLNSIKKPETLARNVGKTIAMLENKVSPNR